MKKFKLKGLVKVTDYPFRKYTTDTMFYNELGEQFVLCVDEGQHCCEDFNFEHDDYKNDEIISYDGIKITVEYDDTFEFDFGGALNIKIIGTEKTYNFRVSNNHNGYYSHAVSLIRELDGHSEYIWEEWL